MTAEEAKDRVEGFASDGSILSLSNFYKYKESPSSQECFWKMSVANAVGEEPEKKSAFAAFIDSEHLIERTQGDLFQEVVGGPPWPPIRFPVTTAPVTGSHLA